MIYHIFIFVVNIAPMLLAHGNKFKSVNSNMFNGKFIKTKDFEMTLTSNCNANLSEFVNPNEELIIAVSARLKDNERSLVACTPYQYIGDYKNKICGIHCASEGRSTDISSKTILGRIYYI